MEQYKFRRIASALIFAAGVAGAPALAFAQDSGGPTPEANGAVHAEPPNQKSVSMSQATETLVARGYTNVGPLSRDGNYFLGQAMRNGQTAQVRVNANTGQIE